MRFNECQEFNTNKAVGYLIEATEESMACAKRSTNTIGFTLGIYYID